MHCASVALSDAARYLGHQLDEAMCFGLGSGLGGIFWQDDSYSLPVGFNGRTLYLEPQFFASFGVSFRWHTRRLGWEEIRSLVDQGSPLLIVANLAHLDYVDTITDFAAHTLLLVGYDEDSEEVLIADTEYPELKRLTLGALHRAMTCKSCPPFFSDDLWHEVGPFDAEPIEVALCSAIKQNVELMVKPRIRHTGLTAIRELAADLPTWATLPRWRGTTLGFYELVERRGTGGGAFRFLYARFLEQAAKYLPPLTTFQVAERMRESGNMWREMALILYGSARCNDTRPLLKAARIAEQIGDLEEALMGDLEYILRRTAGTG